MLKNNAFCSICTLNYSAYAATLSDSLKKAGHQEPHYVLIIDPQEKYNHLIKDFHFTPVFIQDLEIPHLKTLIKKYSAFELSNVLKPYFMSWLLNKYPQINYLVYLDTDIYVYSPLNHAFKYLDQHPHTSILLTPHISNQDHFDFVDGYSTEKSCFMYGLYNGGFYCLKNDQKTLAFLDWHYRIIEKHGYSAPNNYMYVDQKILDIAPTIFEFIDIYRNIRYNVGHWNCQYREITLKDDLPYINQKPLVFFHFSQIHSPNGQLYLSSTPLSSYPTLKLLAEKYLEELHQHSHLDIIHIKYGYKKLYKDPKLQLIDPLKFSANQLEEAKNQLSTLNQLNKDLSHQLSQITKDKDEVTNQLHHSLNQLNQAVTQLKDIYNSQGWHILTKLYRLRDLIIPKSTKDNIRKFIHLTKEAGINSKTIHQRQINRTSRKIVYVGPRYHSKTKSTDFLINYLKKYFQVTEVTDSIWTGEAYPDLSFINDTYLGIVFFQNLPSPKIYNSLKNDNKIFFPMFDGHGYAPLTFWQEYPNLKIINFSSTLHQKLSSWGFESLYLQYFPKPLEFFKTQTNRLFFWQRISQININTVEQLLDKTPFKVHLHKSIDPNHTFLQPSVSQEKKFQISYSEWFKSRSEMQQVIKKCDAFVAPREYEGIGLSFLEAMAMGKAVIAVNNPTMNEYIINHQNGYLFDLNDPKPIDFSNLQQVQENAYQYIVNGRKQWNRQKSKIIDFIKK